MISEATRTLLANAVLHVWNDPALWRRQVDGEQMPAVSAALTHALHEMVAEARERALRAEELIVAFKELLAGLPALNAPERRLEATHFRERLITECIRAYYTR